MSYISAATVGEQVLVWVRDETGRHVQRYNAPLEYYYEDPSGEWTTVHGVNVVKKTFNKAIDLYSFRKKVREAVKLNPDIRTYELLMGPEFKILQRHFSGSQAPDLKISSIDIEVNFDPIRGFSSVANPYAPINAVAIKHEWKEGTVCYAVPPPGFDIVANQEAIDSKEYELVLCQNERELLLAFCAEIEETDCMTAWNGDFFDFPYIAKRLEIIFGSGRGEQYAGQGMQKMNFPLAPTPKFQMREVMGTQNELLDMTGRICCDLMALFKKFEPAPRESYKLESIADESLKDFNKLEYEGSLSTLYHDHFLDFCDYNVRDTDILEKLEAKYKYVRLANQLYHLSNGLFHQVKGTVKLADLAIMDFCNKKKMVLPDRWIDPNAAKEGKIEGAIVLEPKQGMHKWFAFVDVGSLYPNAICTNNISPETLWGQFAGTETDYDSVIHESDAQCTINFDDGSSETKTGKDWKKYLIANELAISGYGTVFRQDIEGVIPAILQEWKKLRKHYQKLKKQTQSQLDVVSTDLERDKLLMLVDLFDSYQYAYKIKLNSLYGALSNKGFCYFRKALGESTTSDGRLVLRHQCGFVNHILGGEYTHLGDMIIMGDTDSSCFLTGANCKEDAILISDEVAVHLNADYPRFCQQAFLVKPEKSNYIQAAREIVCSSGIFVAKKHYMAHIVDKEGESVDQMKIMGVATKKTSIPRKIAKRINDMITRYIKGEAWQSVGKDILSFKKELLGEMQQATDTEILRVGIPKNVNKLNDYTKAYAADPKTRLPQHVSGSILWNKCITELFPEPEAISIPDGSKVKILYLSRPYERFKVICVPHDITVLPKWLKENFTINIQTQIDKLVESPIEHIVECTGVTVPSLDDELLEDLFIY